VREIRGTTCGNERVLVARRHVGDASEAVDNGVFLGLAAVDHAAFAWGYMRQWIACALEPMLSHARDGSADVRGEGRHLTEDRSSLRNNKDTAFRC
jgi:hypothetical protein